MAVLIENLLKEANFTDEQIKVLSPIFKNAQDSAYEDVHTIQLKKIKDKLNVVIRAIILATTILIALGSFFCQKIFSDMSALKVTQTNTQQNIQQMNIYAEEEIQIIKSNQANMQKNIKSLLEKDNEPSDLY